MKIDRKSPQTHRVGGMGIASSKWTAGKGRRPFAPRRWARYVLVGYKRVTMDMFSAGESLGRGSGGVKGRGERPGGGLVGVLTWLGGSLVVTASLRRTLPGCLLFWW